MEFGLAYPKNFGEEESRFLAASSIPSPSKSRASSFSFSKAVTALSAFLPGNEY